MKTCPICNATSFDDMEICFGCMHRFGDEPLLPFEIMDSDEIEPEEPRVGVGLTADVLPEPEGMLPPNDDGVRSTIVPVPGSGFNLVISVQPVSTQMPTTQQACEERAGLQPSAVLAGSVQ